MKYITSQILSSYPKVHPRPVELAAYTSLFFIQLEYGIEGSGKERLGPIESFYLATSHDFRSPNKVPLAY